MNRAKEQVSMRLDPDLLARLREATQGGTYPPTMTQIVERGIELALLEMADSKLGKRGGLTGRPTKQR